MAIFGRKTARQRLRRATRESLTIPAFSSAVDCTSWVIGGLWSDEFSTITAETAAAADYLRADLQWIVDSANEELKAIRRAGIPHPVRQAEETRVIKAGGVFAVRRVESAVGHLHAGAYQSPTEYGGVEASELTADTAQSAGKGPGDTERGRHAATVVSRDHGSPPQAIGSAKQAGPAAEHEDVDPNTSAPAYDVHGAVMSWVAATVVALIVDECTERSIGVAPEQ